MSGRALRRAVGDSVACFGLRCLVVGERPGVVAVWDPENLRPKLDSLAAALEHGGCAVHLDSQGWADKLLLVSAARETASRRAGRSRRAVGRT